MKTAIIIYLFIIGLGLTSCQPEEITPNPPATPVPIDTTDTTDTTIVVNQKHFIFEMFNTSGQGNQLKNTVDSIVYRNLGTGYHKSWTINQITWGNYNTYGGQFSGNYSVLNIPAPTIGNELNVTVYFNSSQQKNCWVAFNEDEPNMNIGIATSYGTNTYTFTKFY